MLTFKVMLESEPQSLGKPTAESAIADAHRLLGLGEPRYAAVAARNALQVLLMDGCREAMALPTIKGKVFKPGKQWHPYAHFLAGTGMISRELFEQTSTAMSGARKACHIYPIDMDKVHFAIQTAEKLFAAVKGKRA